jgi:hypothetical protein
MISKPATLSLTVALLLTAADLHAGAPRNTVVPQPTVVVIAEGGKMSSRTFATILSPLP